LVNSSYVRYIYGPNYVETWSTVNTVADEAHTLQIADGAGRVIATAKNHPGSVGGFSGQLTVYDAMGRAIKQSNPTETSVNISSAPINPYGWAAAGDDASGWIYTQQTYDWKGRPLVTTNQDGTTKTASYTGCGCAGGEVVTLTDEGTIDSGVAKRRQQKVYSDVLGRTVKTEILNWQGGAVFSATVTTYNVRDQATLVRQYAGAEGSPGYQDTTTTYDGYGRLQTQHVPEQNAGTSTVWTYNADDTVNTVTDARGAVSSYSYTGTNRHLVKQITHTLTGSPTITNSFTYDSVGNRLSMTDSAGSASYSYNTLAQLTSETRTIPNVGNFTLTYTYNLGGELTGITDPFAAAVGYTYDNIGRITAVMSSNYVLSSYATNLQYRATDALKSLTYSNSKTLTVGYNANLQVSTYEIPGLMKKSYQYYDDGQLKFTQDQLTTNSKFDRLEQYDHTGRQTKALTGQEARGGAATDDRPYNETMSFDVMGHLVLRDVHNWDRHDSTGTETYVNNRHSGWSYDADGRLTMGNGNYCYDAAGQISSFDDGDQFKTDQVLDADGNRVRSEQKTLDPNTNQWVSTEIKYYIHSTVLGQVLTEVSDQGAKQRTFVYAGGKILAIQVIDQNQEVVWEHYDASDGSYRETDIQGNAAVSAEMDSMGADAGLIKPLTWPPASSPGKLEPYYTVPGLDNATSGCVVDGIQMPCDMVTNENSMQCPNNHCGPVLMDKVDKKTGKVIGEELSRPFEAHADESFGYLFRDALYTGHGYYWSAQEESGHTRERNHAGDLPQKTSQTKSDCANVVDDLVSRAPKAVMGSRSDMQAAAGRVMGLLAKNKFSQGHADPNLGVTGFQQYLIAGGQGADVYKHIYGVAGAVLIGTHYVAGGFSITPQPGARSARTGWNLAQAQLDADKAQQNDPAHRAEAAAEVADDYAAIDTGKWMGQAINGDLTSDQLRQNIFNRLCDH
jgi:YD repeat-containing protein